MACAEDNWQTKLPFINQRTKHVFNKELLSDVKFIVPVSNGELSDSKVIPAHKFVLAISSPVFYAMFYGQMAEPTDSVEVPDCEYESLLELLRFLYSDEVNLTGSNAMQLLYLAKKYMVPSLAEKCAEFLRDNLEASNVFSILPHAQKYEDKDLEDRCWHVIDRHGEEAVTSDEFVTIERSLVESVVKRESLNVREVELFKAVDRWATVEGERQGISSDSDAKRRIIGEQIIKAIRFPLISQKDFASVVFDSNILSFKEVGDMLKFYSGVTLTSPLPFTQAPRFGARCYRFKSFNPPDTRWSYGSLPDCIGLNVNMTTLLHGVQHFGREGGKYTVTTEVKDASNGSALVKQSGSYMSQKDEVHAYYGFHVLFKPPVYLYEGKLYQIVSVITGPTSWYGEEGEVDIVCNQVKVKFAEMAGSNNGSTVSRGQFPALLFS